MNIARETFAGGFLPAGLLPRGQMPEELLTELPLS